MLIFLLWFFSWFLTWVDDLIIFASTYKLTKTLKDRLKAMLWLLSWVFIMMILVFFIWNVLWFLEKWAFLWFWMPLYLARSIVYSEDDAHENASKKIWFYGMWFLWFAFNCTDDIVYNTVVIAGQDYYFQSLYFLWLLLWVFVMIIMSIFYSKKVKDYPDLRAGILAIISVVIFVSWVLNF